MVELFTQRIDEPLAESPRPLSIEQQIDLLKSIYPTFDYIHVEDIAEQLEMRRRRGEFFLSNGLYLFPKATRLAQELGITDVWGEYGDINTHLVECMGEKIQTQGIIQEKPAGYRLLETTKHALRQIEQQQPGDICVLPIALQRLCPRGSVWGSRRVVDNQEDIVYFGLPSGIVSSMLAEDPGICASNVSAIDCIGDEVRRNPQLYEDDNDFERSMTFYLHSQERGLGMSTAVHKQPQITLDAELISYPAANFRMLTAIGYL